MQVWSQAAILAKNQLQNDGAFLIFLQLDYPGLETIRLVRNTEDVKWRGNTWICYPFQLDSSSEDGKTMPSINVQVSNCGGIIQQYIQHFNGLCDATVKIMVAYSANLAVDAAEFELDYLISSTGYDEQWVKFTLSGSSELVNRFPNGRYINDYCPYVCHDIRCGYAGAGDCINTLESCLIQTRFGGEPGIQRGR